MVTPVKVVMVGVGLYKKDCAMVLKMPVVIKLRHVTQMITYEEFSLTDIQ